MSSEGLIEHLRVEDCFRGWEWKCVPTTLTQELDRQSVCMKYIPDTQVDLTLLKKEICGTDPRHRPSFGNAVFNPEPFAKGAFRTAFEGQILLGAPHVGDTWGGWHWGKMLKFIDPRTGPATHGGNACAECVVKKLGRHTPGGDTQSVVSDLRALHAAAELAHNFNKDRGPPLPIHFVKGKLYRDQLTSEDVEELAEMFKDMDAGQEAFDHLEYVRQHRTENVYLVEPKLSSFIKRNSNTGWVQEVDGETDVAHSVAQAFSHWTWSGSDGALLVCDLQGTHDLILTDPVIHTRSGRSTLTDLGERGICSFFKTHVCSPFCSDLKRPDDAFMRKYNDLVPGVKRTTYWFETVAVSAEAHEQEGATCFANAAATVIRAALARQVENTSSLKEHNDIVTEIVLKYGMNAADLHKVLLEFCPHYNLHVSKVEAAEAKHWVRKGHAVAVSFWLTSNQWAVFQPFYAQYPTDVLTELPHPTGDKIGHAVIAIGVSGNTWELKKSWGKDFADEGKFKIGIDLLGRGAMYFHVFHKCELSKQDEAEQSMSEGNCVSESQLEASLVRAGPDRKPEAIPDGMALVEMHGKFKGDSCAEIVSYLYGFVWNGQERSMSCITSKSHTVHVPADDLQELADVYGSDDFQQSRRGFEEDAKIYNKTIGKRGGARCARLRFFKRHGGEVFPRTCANPGSSGALATNSVSIVEDETSSAPTTNPKDGIKKGAAEIAERDQDHVPEVKVLTTLGMFAVPCTAETTIGEIRQKVQEWKPEYSLEQIELVCKDKDAWGPLFNKTSRPRDDDETVESLWSDWDIPRRMMQVALWIKEKTEETGEWESTFWKMLEESKCDDWSFQGHTI